MCYICKLLCMSLSCTISILTYGRLMLNTWWVIKTLISARRINNNMVPSSLMWCMLYVSKFQADLFPSKFEKATWCFRFKRISHNLTRKIGPLLLQIWSRISLVINVDQTSEGKKERIQKITKETWPPSNVFIELESEAWTCSTNAWRWKFFPRSP